MRRLLALLLVLAMFAVPVLAEEGLHTLWGTEFGVTTLAEFQEIAKQKTQKEFSIDESGYFKKAVCESDAVQFFGHSATVSASFGDDNTLSWIEVNINSADSLMSTASEIYEGLREKYGTPDDGIVVIDGRSESAVAEEVPTNGDLVDFGEIERMMSGASESSGVAFIWGNIQMSAVSESDSKFVQVQISSSPYDFDQINVAGRMRDVADGLQ